ncbi:glycoside hydrolase family 2 TIM barrel-domain containing protein [Rhodanobacter lindaniclasticus]
MRSLGLGLLAWLLSGWAAPVLAAPSVQDSPRVSTSLASDWRYADGDPAGAQAPGFDDAGWQPVSLPHTWNADDAFDKRHPYRRGVGWYRRALDVPPPMRGRRVFLRFEGANQVAEVFVNGHAVGRHVGGYTAFAFDITPQLRFDAPNLLAVRVDNRHDNDIPPLEADFTFYGGLYRNVWLVATDPVHIDVLDHASPGVFIDTPRASAEAAVVRLRGSLVNQSAAAREVRVRHRLFDAEGREVARVATRLKLAAGAKAPFDETTPAIHHPRLWSPDSPNLYRAVTEVLDGDRVLDRVDNRFGVRWFHFDPDRGFILNGKPVPLHGSNRHQDLAGHGNALSDARHRRDVELVKGTGFNFLRLAHYPQADAVLDAADELGLAVWEEIPVVNLISTTPAFAEHAQTMLVEMIRQHYNHPSVVMWGYMNEVMQFRPKPEPPGYEADLLALARRLEARARQEDPSRATATAISFTEIDNGSGFQDIPQVLGLNLYFGWYYKDLASLGPWLDQFHARHPDRPVFISEYGADSDERVHARQPRAFDFSTEYQQRFHEANFAQMAARPYLAGTAVWAQFDFGSNGRQDSKFGLNQKGLYFYDRTPKDVAYYYRARLRDDPVLRIAAHEWTRRAGSDAHGASQAIKVYANVDEVELLHNGATLGRVRPENATARFEVNLVPGENRLEARGSRHGQAVRDSVVVDYDDRQPLFTGRGHLAREIAINAGGDYAVVTGDGTVWEADRAYAPGRWGHVGGHAVLTHHRIYDTGDDPLWQDTLAGADAWRFDVPDGDYALRLGFVEVEHDEPGARVFDVLVNDQPLVRDLDLAASKGRYGKVEYATRVRVRGGRGVAIDMPAKAGESTISTLRLSRLPPGQ